MAKAFPHVQIVLRYHPFMIDPATHPDGEEYMAYNRRRWGSDGWTAPMRAAGRREGAAYSNWKWWPNTTHAARLLLFCERTDADADALLAALYRMCYDEGENVSLRATVARAAARASIAGGEAYALSDEGAAEVKAALASPRAAGKVVRAAPWFVVRAGGGAVDFSGAQETARWVELLEGCARAADEA
ncbi:hypothetical protein AB1Y20_011755 [Prymnesium parvum]|uniref:DSBA-like thioredoxin domain-containing protein n=1 Tax=Prymnesium parvum TaxID=97485 RepID=A0AB34IH84_PRYPA|mmetsp:Transcript_14581/g.36444  ORF Transcript_14581/g.36444 Transcript_14581/m.36444 type:complete len:188 (-) Transcript_14581:253-816(-)